MVEDRSHPSLTMNTATVKRDVMQALEEGALSLSAERKEAWTALKTMGLPGNKSEEYKFTPVVRFLEKIEGLNFGTPRVSTTESVTPLISALPCNVLVIHQGKYDSGRSKLIDKIQVTVRRVSAVKGQQDPFELMNLAFATEEITVEVTPHAEVENPIAVVHTSGGADNTFFMPRLFFKIGREASATILDHATGGTLLNNGYTHLAIGENARVEFIQVQDQPDDIQLCHTHLDVEANAHANCFTYSFDGRLTRNNLTLSINGSGVDAHLYGLYLATGKSHIDNHTVVDHRVANSYSNQLYKGIMDGQAKGVFNGKIYVRPDAQKTNAFQSNRNIVLSEEATVNTKPQLEIWADDVKCSHGCTTGQLDEEAMFYLQSRGIGKSQARALLLHAFATETLSAMRHNVIRQYLEERISTRLQAGQ